MHRHPLLIALFAALASSGCGSESNGPADTGSTFLAFSTDFAGYHAWEAFPIPHGTQPDSVHDVNAPLVAYLNRRPSAGSTEFPVGTIVVKEVDQGDVATRKVFAMVKRGGGYNVSGAVNWEWFELARLADDQVQIVWRGVGPPLGEQYGGDPKGACNGCHEAASDNDFVWSSPLRVGSLGQ